MLRYIHRMLDIKTEVLSSAELMLKSRLLLANEDDLSSFLNGLEFSLTNGFVLHSTVPGDRQVIKLPYRAMNYFNRLQVERNSSASSVLLFRTESDEKGMMYSEFDLLVTKCIRLFGLPIDLKERIEIDHYERLGDEGTIRKWKIGRSQIMLGMGTNNKQKQVIILDIRFENEGWVKKKSLRYSDR